MWNPFKKKLPLSHDMIFCECTDGRHEWCVSPGAVIEALHDAREEMSYSNWACDKFDRAEKLIRKYASENGLAMEYTERDKT